MAMSRLKYITLLIALLAISAPALADRLSAVARVVPETSAIRDSGAGVMVELSLTQPVPWRVFTLADPPRLVLDFRQVDWRGSRPEGFLKTPLATAVRTGPFRPGWSRMVLDLAAPLGVTEAGMETGQQDGGARIAVRLDPVDGQTFRMTSGAPDGADWGTGGANVPNARVAGEGAVTVVLDPGHGGIDPGAEAGGVREADLMLTFAREFQDALIRTGRFKVVLTRTEDVFVPLEQRITLARKAGAEVFLSLHADAVAEGRATGATIYTLSETASDEASAMLAERHDRADLLAGVDLSHQDDVIAEVLMDIARLDTSPRSDALADALVAGLEQSVGGLHKRPRLSAGFSVLKSPDVPSALIELGFVSSRTDRERLNSAEWRAGAARGLAQALARWVDEDAARAALVRH